MSTLTFKCDYCSRKYHSKFYLDRHITACEFFSKSAKEQFDNIDSEETVPEPKDMFRFMQEMAIRITTLENDNLKLKQQLNKKVHVLDWLNNESTVKPTSYFDDWFNDVIIANVPTKLDVVFINTLLDGINALFDNGFDSSNVNSLPIRAFNQYNTSLFIYQKSPDNSRFGKWIKISTKELTPWLKQLCDQFSIDFSAHWCTKYADKIQTDETYKNLYIGYYCKILGNNVEVSSMYQKIRLNIFQKIKENITCLN